MQVFYFYPSEPVKSDERRFRFRCLHKAVLRSRLSFKAEDQS